MFKIGDIVQFRHRTKKMKANVLAPVCRFLNLDEDIFKLDGKVVSVDKEVLKVEYQSRFKDDDEKRHFLVPIEFIKHFEVESHHPITKIFL